jgi:hypothetical protein
MRELFSGFLEIAATDHLDGEDEIENLDERVSHHPIVRFVLDYPFTKPHHGELITDAGPSLRQIIDAVRAAYQTMYRGVTIENVPNLDNKRVRGDYGEALHVIDDLVIETISIDDATGALDIFIGS